MKKKQEEMTISEYNALMMEDALLCLERAVRLSKMAFDNAKKARDEIVSWCEQMKLEV